eukprot:675811_1
MLWLVHMVHVWPEYVSSITSDDRRTDVDRPRVHKEDKDGRNACIFEYKQFDGMLDKCIYVSYPNESIEFNDNRAEDWWWFSKGKRTIMLKFHHMCRFCLKLEAHMSARCDSAHSSAWSY